MDGSSRFVLDTKLRERVPEHYFFNSQQRCQNGYERLVCMMKSIHLNEIYHPNTSKNTNTYVEYEKESKYCELKKNCSGKCVLGKKRQKS